MLGTERIVGFIPTRDFTRAKKFYVDTLGLKFNGEDPFALEVIAGENRIRIAKVDKFETLPFTLLGWEVKDIESTAKHLKDSGVVSERYPGMNQNALGIWDSPSGARVAWFKDPEGNLLSISQHPH